MWLKFHQNQRYWVFQGGRSNLLGAYNNQKKLKFMESALFSGWYIWIKFHQNQRYLNFPWGGGRNPLLGGYMWPVMPFFEFGWAIPVKSHVWKFGLDWLKSEVRDFSGGGGQKPPIRGIHVTCDAHRRTWPSYSSQKLWVKIWFGLVEPFKS